MIIGCLGWGSLIWNPRELPVGGKWFEDGPFLPVEFARKSSRGRLTLVIVPQQVECARSLWALFSVSDVAVAREALRAREGVGKNAADHIKSWSAAPTLTPASPMKVVRAEPAGADPINRTIGEWARRLGLDAVLWTGLPPGDFGDPPSKRAPTEQEALAYLTERPDSERQEAEEYIRRAPLQVDTPFRRVFAEKLGWTPINPMR